MFSLNYLLSKLIKSQEKNQLTVKINRLSKHVLRVLNILVKEGMINGYVVKHKKLLVVYLKYYNQKPVFTNFSFISKPSLKVYFTHKDLKNFFIKNGYNLVLIIATPKGLMAGESALYKNLGGEPLFYIS